MNLHSLVWLGVWPEPLANEVLGALGAVGLRSLLKYLLRCKPQRDLHR